MNNKQFNSERLAEAVISVLSDKKNVKKLQQALDKTSSAKPITMMEDRIVNKYIVLPSDEDDTYELLTAKEVFNRLESNEINIFKLGRALAKMQGIQRQAVQGANRYGILKVIPVGSEVVAVAQSKEKKEPIKTEKVTEVEKTTKKVKKFKKKDKTKSKVDDAISKRIKIRK